MKGRPILLLAALVSLPAASALEGPHVLRQVSARASGASTVVTLHGEGTPSFTAYRVDSPLQVVIELSDGRLGEQTTRGTMRLETALTRRAEVAELDEETGRTVRVAIDLKRPATYDVRHRGSDVIVTLTPEGKSPAAAIPASAEIRPIAMEPTAPKAAPTTTAPKTAATAATPPRTAAAAPTSSTATVAAATAKKNAGLSARPLLDEKKPVAGKTVKAAVSPVTVRSIDLEDRGDVARLVIKLNGSPQVGLLESTRSSNECVLRLENTKLPAGLARTYDAALRGPVSTVAIYPDPERPSAVRIVARLEAAVTPTLRQDGNQVHWDFPKAKIAGSYPPSQVAGHGLATVPLQLGPPPPVPPPAATTPTPPPTGAPADKGETGDATTAAPAGRAGGSSKRHGSRVDLDFKDVDIHNMLRVFARVGGVNIVATDEVKGTVTVSMHNVPWDYALDAILRAKGLGQVREGNLIRVAPRAMLEKEMAEEIARNKQLAELIPTVTRLVPLSYAEATKLMPRVQDVLSPRGRVSVDERVNTLIITDIPANLDLAQQLVRNLDTQTPQVLIEARIVEARTTLLRDLGIQWGGNYLASSGTGNPTGLVFPSTIGVAGGNQDQFTTGQGLQNGQAASPNYVVNLPASTGTGSGGAVGLTFGSVAGNFNVNLRLSALENTGSVRILSAPKITSLDNIESSIEQGIAIPVTVTSALGPNTIFVDAKLSLTVKPHITNDGSVIMNVSITKNEPDFSNRGTLGTPSILKKQAKTEMLVRDGDTAVIGGIYTRTTSTAYNKIPFLGDIPILGWLFKKKSDQDDRTELLIFITPRIANRTAASL